MDNIILTESDANVSMEEICAFEGEIGILLPDDFKSFLVQNNGGYPSEELYTPSFNEFNPNTGQNFEQGTDVEQFLSLNEIKFEYGDIVDEGYIPSTYIPFARTSFGNLLLIRLDSTEYNGNICFANHDLFDEKNNRFTISKISDSFSLFLNSLYVPEE